MFNKDWRSQHNVSQSEVLNVMEVGRISTSERRRE